MNNRSVEFSEAFERAPDLVEYVGTISERDKEILQLVLDMAKKWAKENVVAWVVCKGTKEKPHSRNAVRVRDGRPKCWRCNRRWMIASNDDPRVIMKERNWKGL